MAAQQNPPSATNAERAESNSAGDLELMTIVPQPRVDLANMTDREHECHLSGYLSGVLAGIDLGRDQMDSELATIQRRAHEVVQSMAKLDPWTEAQQKIRIRSEQAAARYRGQGQPWPLDIPA